MTERCVVVLVHISEAKGLYNGNENVLVTASLGGLSLETDNVVPSNTTVFDVNIIWETDIKAIKRMKTENLPIKLECFSVGKNGNERTLIGFVIFPIRGVPMIYGERGRTNTAKWHKLIGLSSQWKDLKPEISLYCTITEPENVKSVTLKRDSKSLESISTGNMLCSQMGLYVKLHQEGQYIQLGSDDDDSQLFVVHINLRSLNGLDIEQGEHDKFHIQYILFGSPSEDRMLVPNELEGGKFSIQEKITIQFRASPKTIQEYFNNIFYIPVELCCNNAIIGFVRFSLALPAHFDMAHPRGLVYQAYDRCTLTSSSTNTQSSPWIEYEFSIKLPNPSTPTAKQSSINDNESSSVSLAPSKPSAVVENLDLGGYGDSIYAGSMSSLIAKSATPHSIVTPKQSLIARMEQVSSANTNPNHIPMSGHSSHALLGEPAKVTHKTFSFKLTLKTIEFCRKAELGIWQLSWHHPKAHTPLIISNVTLREITHNAFDNTELVLYFSAEVDGIRSVIESEPCVLHIKGPHGFIASAELDNGTLLDQIDNKQSNQLGIVIMENEIGEKVAMAQASAELTDLGANLNAQQRKFAEFLQPKTYRQHQPHLDEELAYKIVEELEDWKSKQQEVFLVDLKRREINHLSRLTEEWTQRRTDLESALAHKLEQCSLLTSALEIANHNIQDSQKVEQERQRQFQESKMELERSYVKQLRHLQEMARRTESDAEHAAKLANLRFDTLNDRYTELKQDHAVCKTMIADQNKELEVLRTLSLPTNEAAQLLQEMKSMHQKLDRVQSSKSFYKQQWTNAVREMEKLECSASTGCLNDQKSTESVGAECDNRLVDMILSEKAHLFEEQEELRTIFETLDDVKE